MPRSVGGEGALTKLTDLTITVREKGVAVLTPLNVSFSPVRLVWKVSVVVLGSSRRLVLFPRSPENETVSPTAQRSDALGLAIVTAGSPTPIVTASVAVPPLPSVTCNWTRKLPALRLQANLRTVFCPECWQRGFG